MAGSLGGIRGAMTSKTQLIAAPSLQYDAQVAIEHAMVGRLDGVARATSGIDGNIIDFELPPQGDGVYLNMKDLRVYGRAQILKADGTKEDVNKQVAPVNDFGRVVFTSVEARLNENILSTSSFSDTHYKSYLSDILTQPSDLSNMLQTQMFYPDTAGKFTDRTDANKGYKARKALCDGSKVFDFTAPIQCDFLNSNAHLGPGNKLSFRLHRGTDEQLIMAEATATYKLKFTHLVLLYSRIITNLPNPRSEVHLYPHTEVMKFPMAKDTTNIELKVQQGGDLPRAAIVFFVETAAMNGQYDKNMLEFEHLDISSINARKNGGCVPSEPLTPNFKNGVVGMELSHLFQNIGVYRSGRGGFIDREKFLAGYTVFPFDFSPDKCGGYHMHNLSQGTLTIEARCEAMKNPTTAIVYLIWDMEVTIDRSSGVPGMYSVSFVSSKQY